MQIEESPLSGVYFIQLNPKSDSRGYFMRFWDNNLLSSHHLPTFWCQESLSYTQAANTLRGLHFQYQPQAQAKYIVLLRGKITDVVVNIKVDSIDFGKWHSFELSADMHQALFIPSSCAHGFVTRSDDCLLLYKMDVPYSPNDESGIIWNDQDLQIDWNTANPILSERDKHFGTLRDVKQKLERIKR